MKLLLHKIFNWEYWPYQIVYIPIYFVWIYYAIKSKSLFFFNAANPTIKNGGFFNESKYAIYELIPQQYYPKTIVIPQSMSFAEVKNRYANNNFQFPIIVKPDIGLRGTAVKKIDTYSELESYNSVSKFDYLIQELIPFSNEVGIFYVRFPNESKGKITGIVSKEFLIVKGDGIKTLKELIVENPRYALQYKVLEKEYANQFHLVLKENEELNLVPIGNHARGAKFIDVSHLIDDKLNTVIDTMCQKIEGFYFGRIDIMFDNWVDFKNGKKFMIVEVNGAASEPTHIYDPKHSIFFAWKEIIKHIQLLYQISKINRLKNHKNLTFREGLQELKKHNLHFKQLKKV